MPTDGAASSPGTAAFSIKMDTSFRKAAPKRSCEHDPRDDLDCTRQSTLDIASRVIASSCHDRTIFHNSYAILSSKS